MPTYKNSGTAKFPYERILDGMTVLASAGATFTSYRDYTDISFIVEQSAVPMYNPVLAMDKIQLHGANSSSAIHINSAANVIEIFDIQSANITAYYENSGNTPALHSPLGSLDEFTMSVSDNARTLFLVFDAAGSCYVRQRME